MMALLRGGVMKVETSENPVRTFRYEVYCDGCGRKVTYSDMTHGEYSRLLHSLAFMPVGSYRCHKCSTGSNVGSIGSTDVGNTGVD